MQQVLLEGLRKPVRAKYALFKSLAQFRLSETSRAALLASRERVLFEEELCERKITLLFLFRFRHSRLEFFNASCCVNHLFSACVEWVARAAHLHFKFFFGGPDFKCIPTRSFYLRIRKIFWVNFCFH